jgi:hypothetical protein
VGSLGVFVLLVAAIISFVIGALYGKGLLGCNETAAEQKGPKGEIGQTVKFSNVAWQVTAARRATELKAPSYPKKKGNYVIVDFLFTNNADEATKLYPGSLTLLDGPTTPFCEGCATKARRLRWSGRGGGWTGVRCKLTRESQNTQSTELRFRATLINDGTQEIHLEHS